MSRFSDQVGFLEGTYNPREQPDFGMWYDSIRQYVVAEPQLYLRMFTDKAFRRQVLSQTERPLQHKAMLYFAAAHPQIERIRFDSIPEDRVIFDPQTVGRDTIALWFNVPSSSLPDTIKGEITYFKHDTVNQSCNRSPSPEAGLEVHRNQRAGEGAREARTRPPQGRGRGREVGRTQEGEPLRLQTPASGEINPENHLTVDFDYPLVKLDSAAMLLTLTHPDNSIEDIPVYLVRDTASCAAIISVRPGKPGGQYTLTIPEGAITDVAGFSNDSIIGKYTVLDPEKFATVKIHVTGKDDSSKYILQLLDGNNALKQEKRDVTTGDWQFNFVPAGEIKFRVIEDKNGNGKWDSGNVVERRQPERAEIYANDEGEDTFATKANWEVEFSIDMNTLFAPVTMESLSRTLEEREAQRLRREAEKRAKEPKKKGHSHDNNQNNNRMNNSMNSTGMACSIISDSAMMKRRFKKPVVVRGCRMLLAWCFGAAYARLHGGLRHGQRPLRPQTGDEGDVGYLYRRALLGATMVRNASWAVSVSTSNSCNRVSPLQPMPRWSRSRRISHLLYAPCQFRRAAHRLAAPYICATVCAFTSEAAATFSYQLSSDYEDESAKASGMADWKGDYNYKTARDSRWGYGLAGGGGIAFLIRRFEINVRARYYFGLSDIVRNRNKYGQRHRRFRKPVLDDAYALAAGQPHYFGGAELPLQQGGLLDLETASQTRKEPRSLQIRIINIQAMETTRQQKNRQTDTEGRGRDLPEGGGRHRPRGARHGHGRAYLARFRLCQGLRQHLPL